MSGLKSYEFEAKDAFRNWVWSQIDERCRKPPMWRRMFYLAGPNDVDADEIRKRGMFPANCIACDTDLDRVKAVRDSGVKRPVAICGDMLDVLAEWNGDPFDVIYLDTCSTFDIAPKLYDALNGSKAVDFGTLLIVNLIGARERTLTDEYRAFLEYRCCCSHRGAWFAFYVLNNVLQDAEDSGKCDMLFATYDMFGGLFREMCPESYSYRSTVPMHAVSLWWPCSTRRSSYRKMRMTENRRTEVGRKLVAAKAVRTRLFHSN